ncbi:MAG: PAS domain S-box protein, partial [Thermoanaerobaculia bacterium]
MCQIGQEAGGHFRLVGGRGWSGDVSIGSEIPVEDATIAFAAIQSGAPIVIDDMATDEHFAPSAFLESQQIVSTIAVPISTGRAAAWGVLGAHSRTPRHFAASDVEFLRSVATMLAQAVERDRVDQQLVLHAAQQSAIAELSRVALKSVGDALAMMCDIIGDVLDVEYAQYYPGQQISVEDESPLSRCLIERAPVTIEEDEQLGTGVAVPLASAHARFGVLVAHMRRTRPLSDPDVEFIQALANILADAMERERAASALIESEERYREVVEGASELIFTIAPDGTFTSLNAAFQHVTGFSRSEWIGKSYLDILHPDEIGRSRTLFRGLLENHVPVADELRIKGRNADVLLDLTSFAKVENGRVTTIYGFGREVTEARRVERERQRLTRSLQLLLESTVEGIFTLDRDGRCTMVNRAAAAFLQRTSEELLGQRMHELMHPGHDGRCPIIDVLHNGEPTS